VGIYKQFGTILQFAISFFNEQVCRIGSR